MTDFFKTFKIVDFWKELLTLAKFRCASWSGFGDHIVCLFSKHSCSVHFLFNEFNDDKSDCSMLEYRWCIFEFEVGERDFWHQKMSV